MGCKPSTTANAADSNNINSKEHVLAQRYKDNLQGVGQTERQISKLQRAAMNNTDTNTITSSSNGNKKKQQQQLISGPKVDDSGHLVPEEVAKRTFSSISNKETTLGATSQSTTHVQFAHWTQRGYYPDDPHKQNQDEFGAHLGFAGVDEDAMFAVYDGHGKHGHACAQFAQERLPKAIAKHVRRIRCQKYQQARAAAGGVHKSKGGWDPDNWPLLESDEYEASCRKAFLEVNQAMHDAPNVVDTLSGTTATTVNFHGDFVSVSNVGDSRVVLGHRVKDKGGNVVAINCPQTAAGIRRRADSPPAEEEKNDIDDELMHESSYHENQHGSGTTTVASFVRPERNFEQQRKLQNVPGTRVLAIPLSRDQTPYRKDERERVKALGASVMSIDQMQGKEEVHENWGDMVLGETIDTEGDPPRIWVKGKDYPGCAFTRSLGDSMSESVGVNAVPEILSTRLTRNDEYLVIASDGIFEFLTNQAVMEFCASSESPLIACEKIVKAAYQQWLVYEKRTDDITIIVCFLQNFNVPAEGGSQGTTEDLVQAAATVYGGRPEHMESPEMPLTVTSSKARALQAAVDGRLAIVATPEPEVCASVSPTEAKAKVVQALLPPPSMSFDSNEIVRVEIDSLMEEVKNAEVTPSNSVSAASSNPGSVSSGDSDGQNMIHNDTTRTKSKSDGALSFSPKSAARNKIQL